MTASLAQHARVRTNTTKDSVCRIDVQAVKFAELWAAYPSTDPCVAKDKDGSKLFANQCAIRVSHALKKVGVTFKSYPAKRKCWIHPSDDHCLAAKELADWLELQPFVGCSKSQGITGEDWRDKITDRTGIVCFEDYYPPSQGSGGDHIDLWNGSRMTPVSSWLRTRFGLVLPNWSDLRLAKRIRFFPIA
ncbi:type VI secretion system amidase effector protein Tae4 [Variovorax sp. J2P1-59]|uniref:type VI secretion system amidase effector protein Tae4 n=1 Tax=Variovorax flavidus TaxID=3053501 RepID=UPI0025761D3B|nr:type VI secretion system amidase effector protein Tae4 [Variovorax sp. J2P1-59]MDM0075616.1 type VI secretion system amidase effector protein Tae4 [Variovorax sp. J2P1-59]